MQLTVAMVTFVLPVSVWFLIHEGCAFASMVCPFVAQWKVAMATSMSHAI
jgi:hypothetical protein